MFDRGRARQAIFSNDADRFIFFDCIAEAVKQYCIEVHAYSSVMEELSEITGMTIAELRRDQRGPTGNAAKRFAVWALRERTTLSYAQIGEQLRMTESAVAKALAKRRRPLESVDKWSALWLTRHKEKFVVVLPAGK